jgi:hypothetical protein
MDGCPTAIIHLLNDLRDFEIWILHWWCADTAQTNLWSFCGFRIKFGGSFEIAHEELTQEE